MRLALQSLRLAAADYCHERLLSLCAVLTLTAVLTPLLILYGVKFGVVQTLTDRLQHDPRTLEISPVGSGRFTPDYLAQLRQHPSAAFVLPRTRAIAATIDLFARDGTRLTVSLEPSAAGDPLLGRYGAAIPTLMLHSGLDGAETMVVPVTDTYVQETRNNQSMFYDVDWVTNAREVQNFIYY